MSTARETRRLPDWLLVAVLQAGMLAVLLLGGLIAYQGDQLGYLPSIYHGTAPAHTIHWQRTDVAR
jgi:hypothetical protein